MKKIFVLLILAAFVAGCGASAAEKAHSYDRANQKSNEAFRELDRQ